MLFHQILFYTSVGTFLIGLFFLMVRGREGVWNLDRETLEFYLLFLVIVGLLTLAVEI